MFKTINKAFSTINDAVSELNTTNVRIITSISLAIVVVVTTLVAELINKPIHEAALVTLCTFVLSLGGLDVIQFTQKRKSFDPRLGRDNSGTDTSNVMSRRSNQEHDGVEATI